MADRIVVLGWGGEAIELRSAMDASAFVDTGMMRPSLTMWSGPLSDATVLMVVPEWLRKHGGENEKGYREAWSVVRLLVRPDAMREFVLDTPIPLSGMAPSGRCLVTIPGVGQCEVVGEHERNPLGRMVHRRGAVSWNGPSREVDERPLARA